MGSCGATMHVLCQCPEDEVRKIIGYKKAAHRMLLGLTDHDRAFQSKLTVWKLEGELSTLFYSGNSLHLIYFISILKNVLSRWTRFWKMLYPGEHLHFISALNLLSSLNLAYFSWTCSSHIRYFHKSALAWGTLSTKFVLTFDTRRHGPSSWRHGSQTFRTTYIFITIYNYIYII